LHGRGLPKNEVEALKLSRIAADAGLEEASEMLDKLSNQNK
jgi:ribosomal protein L7/L12